MKKLLLSLAVVLSLPTAMSAQDPITIEDSFPDETFRNYVSTNFDSDHDGFLTAAEIKKVKTVNVDGMGISDMTGLELFTELTSLKCSENSLTALNVASNTKLKTLQCTDNQIAELDLSNNLELTKLWCNDNALTELVVYSSKVTELYAYGNQLTSVDITRCTALKQVRLYRNPNLEGVDFTNNTAITRLEIFECGLTALDVTTLTEMTWLSAGNNNLSEVDLSHNTNLTNLTLEGNNLTELDLSANPLLKTLRFEDNQISEIDVTAMEDLGQLRCANNLLTKLDLTQNTALKTLKCDGNQIKQLDLTNCTLLEYLDCSNNELTTLDLSKNTKLTGTDNPGSGKYYSISPQATVIDAVVLSDMKRVAIPVVPSSDGTTLSAEEFSDFKLNNVNNSEMNFAEENMVVVKDDPQADVDFYGKKVSYTYTVPCGSNAVTGDKLKMKVTITTYPYVMYVNPFSQDQNDNFYSGTIILDYDAVVPEGAEAYIATDITLDRKTMLGNGEVVTSEQLSMIKVADAGEVIPANTPVYVKAPELSGMYAFGRNVKELEPVEIPDGNILEGTMTNMTVEPKSVLTLGREQVLGTGAIGFWQFLGTSVPAHRVYIDASLMGDEHPANGFFLNFDGGSDGISVVASDVKDADNVWYNLQGMRMNGQPIVKGVYIVNGKKVMVR